MRKTIASVLLVTAIGVCSGAARGDGRVHLKPNSGAIGLVVCVTDLTTGAPASLSSVLVGKPGRRRPHLGRSKYEGAFAWADTDAVTDSAGLARFVISDPGAYRGLAFQLGALPADSTVTVHQWGADTLRLKLGVKQPNEIKY
jgi:hypothetical protein